MRDILARGDLVLFNQGRPGFQGPPTLAGQTITIWDSANKIVSPYHDAQAIEDMYLVIFADAPSDVDGIMFEGSNDGVDYDDFTEHKTYTDLTEPFEHHYAPRTPHVRVRFKNGLLVPTKWKMSLVAKLALRA